jgi:glutamate 5-kinase
MPSTPLRQNVLMAARRLVVKLGTQVLRAADGELDLPYVAAIADQIHALRKRGVQVTLVSSGAVGAGCKALTLAKRPTDVAEIQAVAAVGQPRLMAHMRDAFARHGIVTAQMLLTRGDFDDRDRFLNLRNCVAHLHALGALPIINENDTVAVEEIRFGDNDMLAAMMCNALRADAMVLLTMADGLLDRGGTKVELVDDILATIAAAKQENYAKSAWGTGGIVAKLEAVRLVVEAGELAVIAHGREPDVLLRLISGEKLGTVFVPAQRKLDSRQRWIALTKRPAGTVTIDDGAVVAVTQRGKSLLAGGIVEVTGRFERGEVLMVRDSVGREVARGLSNYADGEVRLIQGKKSCQFEKALGRPAYAEVIHRDNLVVIDRPG